MGRFVLTAVDSGGGGLAEFLSRATGGGRVTVPIAVRHRLGIGPGDRVVTTIDEQGGVKLRRVERAARSVQSVQGKTPTPPGLQTDELDDLIEEAMSDHADWVMSRMREGLE